MKYLITAGVVATFALCAWAYSFKSNAPTTPQYLFPIPPTGINFQ